MAIQSRNGPVALVLTRQKVPVIDRAKYAPANGLRLGGYVLADAPPPGKPAIILLASGAEVAPALGPHERLAALGIAPRVLRPPPMEPVARQPQEDPESVLPPALRAEEDTA